MNRFRLLYRSKDAWTLRTKRSGFSYEQHLGWLMAAKAWGKDPAEFAELDVNTQALMIATVEAENQIEAIMAEESRRKSQGISGLGQGHNLNPLRRQSVED